MHLSHVMKRQEFEPGEVIFREGDPGRMVYVILDGTADVVASGRHLVTLPRFECFGEMALVDNLPRSASVIASGDSDTQCLVLNRVDFANFLEFFPSIAKQVIAVLTGRLRRALADKDALAKERASL